MMVVHRETGRIEHRRFTDFPGYLSAGKDVLVLNNSRVIRARLLGKREKGTGTLDVLLVFEVKPGRWKVLIKPAKRVKVGERIHFREDLSCSVLSKGAWGEAEVAFQDPENLMARIDRAGLTPLPPYIKRPDDAFEAEDRARYQTVFAEKAGSVAAPTAGMHFTGKVLDQIRSKGVDVVMLTLHVGPGTFRPIRTSAVEDHKMDAEYYSMSADALDRLRTGLNMGKKIAAVGTTSTRTLESVGREGIMRNEPLEGWTDLYIYPPYQFTVVGRLLTNFHLPGSSLLALVASFAGLDLIKEAYRRAVEEKYRFYSYGDCMYIL
jgi:S-adenosylmethionine:tRNA ribosyltransferase-isomerase